jgi:ADP-heptose:LPS heptosyltransferase
VRRPTELAGVVAKLPRALSLAGRYGRPAAVMYFGESPGDDLLATAVVRQWRRMRGSRVAYLTRYPELFTGNDDVAFTAPYDPMLAGAFQLLGVPRIRLAYHTYDPNTDRSIAPAGTHLINLMCASADLPPIERPLPILNFSPAERHPAQHRRVVLQSSVMSARIPILTKDWFPDRMQAVADALRGDAELVQLGSRSDPFIQGTLDLRGRTTLREAAATLAGARLFIGMVGYLMHAAAATGTPSVVIYGGREHPEQSGYAQNRNLFTTLHCSPCWLWHHCPYDRECMREITAGDVIAAARELLE